MRTDLVMCRSSCRQHCCVVAVSFIALVRMDYFVLDIDFRNIAEQFLIRFQNSADFVHHIS